MDSRGVARKLATDFLTAGEPLAWFEELYSLSSRDADLIPWADMAANPNLMSWLERE